MLCKLSYVIILTAADYSILWMYYNSFLDSWVVYSLGWFGEFPITKPHFLREGTHTVFICWNIIKPCQFFPPDFLLIYHVHLLVFLILEGKWNHDKYNHKSARENQKARRQNLLSKIKRNSILCLLSVNSFYTYYSGINNISSLFA